MTDETKTLLAVFSDVDPAAHALDRLRELGLGEAQMNVIAGIPVTEGMLGRPRQWSNVPRLALGGAVAGIGLGLFLAIGAPLWYPIQVGRQALIPIPPSVVVVFEMMMLGMLVATFLGVFLDSRFPSYSPKEYVPEISDGKIAVLFHCPVQEEAKFVSAMTAAGAEKVEPAEEQKL